MHWVVCWRFFRRDPRRDSVDASHLQVHALIGQHARLGSTESQTDDLTLLCPSRILWLQKVQAYPTSSRVVSLAAFSSRSRSKSVMSTTCAVCVVAFVLSSDDVATRSPDMRRHGRDPMASHAGAQSSLRCHRIGGEAIMTCRLFFETAKTYIADRISYERDKCVLGWHCGVRTTRRSACNRGHGGDGSHVSVFGEGGGGSRVSALGEGGSRVSVLGEGGGGSCVSVFGEGGGGASSTIASLAGS